MAEFFKIKFYDSDGGGMRTELTETKDMFGTFEQVVFEVENTKSPWGFNYEVHNEPGHGCAVIQKITKEIYLTEQKIEALQENLNQMYEELK